MTAEQQLAILKKDLQMLTNANDDYLIQLLNLAKAGIKREGIVLMENDTESDMAVVLYAAYLFRKRASSETSMPRYLRYILNNMLLSQKAGVNNDL